MFSIHVLGTVDKRFIITAVFAQTTSSSVVAKVYQTNIEPIVVATDFSCQPTSISFYILDFFVCLKFQQKNVVDRHLLVPHYHHCDQQLEVGIGNGYGRQSQSVSISRQRCKAKKGSRKKKIPGSTQSLFLLTLRRRRRRRFLVVSRENGETRERRKKKEWGRNTRCIFWPTSDGWERAIKEEPKPPNRSWIHFLCFLFAFAPRSHRHT